MIKLDICFSALLLVAMLSVGVLGQQTNLRSRNLRHLAVVRIFPADTVGSYTQEYPTPTTREYALDDQYESWIFTDPTYPDVPTRSGTLLHYQVSGFDPLSTNNFYFDFPEVYGPYCETAGKRVMEVIVNGVVLAQGIDTFAEVGCGKVWTGVRALAPADSSGNYDIYITASTGHAMMSAIHIEPWSGTSGYLTCPSHPAQSKSNTTTRP